MRWVNNFGKVVETSDQEDEILMSVQVTLNKNYGRDHAVPLGIFLDEINRSMIF